MPCKSVFQDAERSPYHKRCASSSFVFPKSKSLGKVTALLRFRRTAGGKCVRNVASARDSTRQHQNDMPDFSGPLAQEYIFMCRPFLSSQMCPRDHSFSLDNAAQKLEKAAAVSGIFSRVPEERPGKSREHIRKIFANHKMF